MFALAAAVTFAATMTVADSPAVPECMNEDNTKLSYIYYRFNDTMPIFSEHKLVPGEYLSDGDIAFADCEDAWQMRMPYDDEARSIIERAVFSDLVYSRTEIFMMLRNAGFWPVIYAFDTKHCTCMIDLSDWSFYDAPKSSEPTQ